MTGQRMAVTVPTELLGDLDKLVESLGETRENLVLAALYRFVSDEDEEGRLEINEGLDALLKPALDELDNGKFVAHEDIVRRYAERMPRAA